jgi:hypothetical protein
MDAEPLAHVLEDLADRGDRFGSPDLGVRTASRNTALPG